MSSGLKNNGLGGKLGFKNRGRKSKGEALTKARDALLEEMKLELYDLPKAFFKDETAKDYYDTVKSLINEKHESAEAIFAELKGMITFGYRTGKKDGDREEGWNTKTNQYEFRTAEDWARMEKRQGSSSKGKEDPQATTDDKGTDEEQPGDSVETTTSESTPEKVDVVKTPQKRSFPLEAVKGIVDPPTLVLLQKLDTESLIENVPAKGKLDRLNMLSKGLQMWQEKVLDLYDKKEDVALFALYQSIAARTTEVDIEFRKVRDQELEEAKKKERTTGTIKFDSFPTLKVPEHGAQAMPSVGFLKAVINGDNYRIYAGQVFLNTEYSQELYEKAPSKGGNIAMYQGGNRKPDEKDYKCVVVGDAHHRFVWGAHHGQSLTAEFIPQPFAQSIRDWSEITYMHNPKHEYTFDVDEEKNAIKASANDGVKKKLFLAAISPMPEYDGKYAKSSEAFIKQHLGTYWKDIQKGFVLADSELKKVIMYLDDLVQKANVRAFDVAVNELMSEAKDQDLAKAVGSMLLESMSGKLPNVALGPTPSIGYYNSEFNVIVLDPKKNATPDALLDTLSFETGNAKRRDAFLDKENSTTNVEFGTMNDYIKILMAGSKSDDIAALVKYLNIPIEHLEPAVAKEILEMEQPALPMPDTNVMPEQKLRSALAWWKMKDWTEEERLQYFSKSAHAEGMAATGSEYKK